MGRRSGSLGERDGIRLEGATLDRAERGELASEGMLSGAIQVSPDGAPTILATDHPVTGGYPVIAVVTDDSLDVLAQLRPGSTSSFDLQPAIVDGSSVAGLVGGDGNRHEIGPLCSCSLSDGLRWSLNRFIACRA